MGIVQQKEDLVLLKDLPDYVAVGHGHSAKSLDKSDPPAKKDMGYSLHFFDSRVKFRLGIAEYINEVWLTTPQVVVSRDEWLPKVSYAEAHEAGTTRTQVLRKSQDKILRRVLKDLAKQYKACKAQEARYAEAETRILALREALKEYLEGDDPRVTFEPGRFDNSRDYSAVLLDGVAIGTETNHHPSWSKMWSTYVLEDYPETTYNNLEDALAAYLERKETK